MLRKMVIGGLYLMVVTALLLIWVGPSHAATAPPAHAVPATPAITPLVGCNPGWGYAASYPSPVFEAAVVGLNAFVYSFSNTPYKYSVDTNSWTAISLPPSGTSDAASAVTDGQYIYLLNGYNGSPLARLQRYDPSTDSYTTLATPPTATANQAVVYLNGKIYRIAGGAVGGETATVDVYTVSTDTWAPPGTVAAYPQALSYLLAVTANGYIYAGGGGGSTLATLTTKTYRYDPAANTWDDGAVSDFRQAHYAGSSSILNGRWIVAGGYDVDYQIDKNVEALDLSQPSGSWVGLPWMPAWRFLTSGAVVNSVFYLIGGFGATTSMAAEVQYYTDGPCYGTPFPPTVTVTPTAISTQLPCGTSLWSRGTSYPIPVAGAAVAAFQDAVIYSFGGYANEAAVANAYSYRPSTNAWLPLAPLPEARTLAGAVSDGTYLYILNGSDVTTLNSNASLYRYDPASNTYTTLAVPPTSTAGQAIALLNGKIYRIAGDNSSHFPGAAGRSFSPVLPNRPSNEFDVDTVDVYTISTNTWAPAGTIANYPLFTSDLNAVAYNGYIYTEGGGGNGSAITDKTYRYDPTTNTWDDAAVPDLPTPLTRSAVDLLNGRWIVAGGNNQSIGALDTVFMLNLANPTAWAMLSPLPIAEDYTSGARSGNDFYVVGGITVSTVGANTVVQRYTDGPVCPVSATSTTLATASPTSTTTSTRTALPSSTALPGTATPAPPSSTATGVPSATSTTLASATPCTIQFNDVTDPTAYYYQGVYYLACRGVISGYSDGTFRPFNNTTRGQMTKIVILAFNIPPITPPARDTFVDVDTGNVFYRLIETAAARGIVSGYFCGGINSQTGQAEPCDSLNRPYFRPSNTVTRGQLTKIVVGGAGWPLIQPTRPTFSDVATDNVFYPFIETAVCHGILGGYADGTFRPTNATFRAQIAKIVYGAVTNAPGTCVP